MGGKQEQVKEKLCLKESTTQGKKKKIPHKCICAIDKWNKTFLFKKEMERPKKRASNSKENWCPKQQYYGTH